MNRLCRDLGHSWMLTTAANYRVCTREDCRASERLVNGHWKSNASLYRSHRPILPSSQSLWETAHERTPS